MPLLPGRVDPPFWWKPWIPLVEWWQRPRKVRYSFYVSRDLAWFRVCGYGLWFKWGRGTDLFTTRKHAHYMGRLRWKVLRRRPQG